MRKVEPAGRFTLKIHDINPERLAPNGDRYVVEVIDIDETILLGQLLIVTQNPNANPNDPQRDPTVERRGVLAAVIVRVGNGHLLGLPDWPSPPMRSGEFSPGRDSANVPMFYQPGDVVLVDFNARGRDVKILAKEIRIVGQIDVLVQIEGIKLVRNADGDWQEA